MSSNAEDRARLIRLLRTAKDYLNMSLDLIEELDDEQDADKAHRLRDMRSNLDKIMEKI